MAKSITLRSGAGEHRVEIADGRITVDGVEVEPPLRAYAVANGDTRWVFLDGNVYEFEVSRQGRKRAGAHHDSLTAPMPATVVRINAPVGTAVKRGDTLVVLEAMKMELPVRATADGTITAVNCQVGDLVQPGVSLIELE
jgi:biotin carboxyl carrier protein